jgi:hypothetical protein
MGLDGRQSQSFQQSLPSLRSLPDREHDFPSLRLRGEGDATMGLEGRSDLTHRREPLSCVSMEIAGKRRKDSFRSPKEVKDHYEVLVDN